MITASDAAATARRSPIGWWATAFTFFLLAAIDDAVAYVVLFAGAALVGVGEAIYAPTADALAAALAPPHLRGRYAALHQMAWGVSEIITPTVVAVALAGGRYAVWLILGGLAVAVVAAYRAVERAADGRDGVAGA